MFNWFGKIVSWNAISKLALDKITPVRPPIVKSTINPTVNINGVVNLKLPPYNVATHEKILIPVGTAITIVAAVKYALVSTKIKLHNLLELKHVVNLDFFLFLRI